MSYYSLKIKERCAKFTSLVGLENLQKYTKGQVAYSVTCLVSRLSLRSLFVYDIKL